PNNNAAVGALNGNTSHTVFAPFAVTPANPIQPEATFYIRWRPVVVSGMNTNDGLAIDDFTIGTALGPGLAGDYNNNGVVDTADYIVWRDRLNTAVSIPNDITPGTVIAQDYTEWLNRFGKFNILGSGSTVASSAAIPEPASLSFVLLNSAAALLRHRYFFSC